MNTRRIPLGALLTTLLALACTQESQNRLGRAIQNWTGTNGVLDVYAGERLAMRFIAIDKLTTSLGTGARGEARAYRFGYGIYDENQNWIADPGEKKLYFEISDYSTSYVFYENPR
ncbi:MAG: hypothetical protein FJ108_05160 [Deltaproteobacteria bacterium]|nr:hypothetical protein [Deltaproteobacteria bacterium]